MSMSSFFTHPRRSLSVFSNQAPTWRGPQGKTIGRAKLDIFGCFPALAQKMDWGLYLSLKSCVGDAPDWKDIQVIWSSSVVKEGFYRSL